MKYTYVRRLPEFTYLAPKTVAEAISWLFQYQGKARVIAGGTDLLPEMKRRDKTPQYLIGLKNIPGLDYIEYDEQQGLSLGPLVTINDIETSTVIKEKYPVLSEAAAVLGSAQVRNLATVAGNLCSALPSADMAPGLIALGAEVKVASVRGERTIAVEKFFTAPAESVLAEDELLLEIQVPAPPPDCGMTYIKHMPRRAMDLSLVGVAVLVVIKDGTCQEVKIALGTVAPTPIRALRAESVLKGMPFDYALAEQAALAASQECEPRSSKRASADYRREMVKVLVQRALKEAVERVGR
jgi:CO/xanthine dehydrogenase FAD-binding subunit